ncbi:DNA repair protein RadC [Halomonas sp. JS92-SW72]|uniref:RadC family protein n=1 Tax=Halomonas sp. JS92-SW72 TaxID=2306583 RepID=UPI000E5AC84C|nr:DNA repair protein RadC [Halomonas sp. JS92-SW72]AXY44021.1 DNA repair protein RadC [Halomonas sp. JS92-SW72]
MNHRKLKAGEVAGTYDITAPITEAELVSIAQAFARRKLARGRKLTRPNLVFDYLQVLFQGYEHEVFSALFLDSQHRLIHFETLFRGTIDSASVYPREVVKRALAHNAAAVIFVHNHPSGDPEPSDADRRITQRLSDALALIEVRVIDHIVVGGDRCISLAERGDL